MWLTLGMLNTVNTAPCWSVRPCQDFFEVDDLMFTGTPAAAEPSGRRKMACQNQVQHILGSNPPHLCAPLCSHLPPHLVDILGGSESECGKGRWCISGRRWEGKPLPPVFHHLDQDIQMFMGKSNVYLLAGKEHNFTLHIGDNDSQIKLRPSLLQFAERLVHVLSEVQVYSRKREGGARSSILNLQEISV